MRTLAEVVRRGGWGRVLALVALITVVGGGGVFVLDRVLERIAVNHSLIRSLARLQRSERAGRVIATTATCAVANGIANAGRVELLANAANVPPPRYERNLRRLGRPVLQRRRVTARVVARRYVRAIQNTVRDATGRTDLVTGGGVLDCARLAALPRVALPKGPK